MEPLIVERSKEIREHNPGLGCAKLYILIKEFFNNHDSLPGRDIFIEMMRRHGLMVQMKRRAHYVTTDSNHPYRKYENLIKNIVPSRPNEIWVSDITYVETDECVCYLSLVTDAYSHKIVGWSVGPTLETVYPLQALKMALNSIDMETASLLIHHSDRGSQYCSYKYVRELKKHNIRISMTQSGDPLENPIAERANGILKVEWLYRMSIPSMATLIIELTRIIEFYNTKRPHMSIGMKTPDQVHHMAGYQKRCWRNSWERRAAHAPV